MKTFDSASANLSSSFVAVTENIEQVLSSTGVTQFRLHAGDLLEVTDSVFVRTRKGSDGKERTIPYIGCYRNDRACAVPFSVFRAVPAFEKPEERDAFFAKSPLLKALSECGSDAERFNYLKEHSSLKVAEIVTGRTRDWHASPAGTASDKVQYTTGEFAVLVEA